MERLTQWFGSSRLGREVGVSAHLQEQYTVEELLDLFAKRLAAYEDTGLEPEEVEIMRETKADAQFMLSELCRLCDYDRLEELARAEQEGRLVVLPCKIDDPIYLIRGEKEPRKRMKYRVEEYDIDHFTIGGTMIPMITACSKENEWEELIDGTQKGYEYFSTREEAEAALKGGTEDGQV